jgi:hypothetical protein
MPITLELQMRYFMDFIRDRIALNSFEFRYDSLDNRLK